MKVVSEQDHYESWEVETGFSEESSKSLGEKPRSTSPVKTSKELRDGWTNRAESRCSHIQSPMEVTRNISASARRARVLLNYPKWEQEQVPLLGGKASKVQPLSGPTIPFHSADALICIPVLGWDVTRA